MSDPITIPGFFAQETPKADQNIEAQPDGTIQVDLGPFKRDLPLPVVDVLLSKDCGRYVNRIESFPTNEYVFTDLSNPQDPRIVFKLRPDEASIVPGTYMIRVMKDGVELFKKSLTVKNHPSMGFQTGGELGLGLWPSASQSVTN